MKFSRYPSRSPRQTAHKTVRPTISRSLRRLRLILERKATVGSVVNSGDELFVITDTSKLWMIGAANEEDLSKLREGQQVRIEVRAYTGRIFSGHILKLGEQLDPSYAHAADSNSGAKSQGLLKPEMYATAVLQQAWRHPALFVPEEAIQEIGGDRLFSYAAVKATSRPAQ